MLILAVALIAAVIAAWQVVHRTSPLVKRWAPSSFPRQGADPLSVLDSGATGRPDEEVLVLLHGLGATGDYFGAFYDGLSRKRRVVIVDLLGFGHSLDEELDDFSVDAHVESLEEALESLGLVERTFVVAAHSMSSAVAMTWASHHPDRVRHVYLWGPPMYRPGNASESIGKEYGAMGRLFARNTSWAQRACRVNCANRELSGHAMTLMAPRWPTGISSGAARHTWEAYSGSFESLITEFDWSSVFPAKVPVTIFRGANDPVGDQQYVASMAGTASVRTVADSDHHVALERPDLLFDELEPHGGPSSPSI